MNPAEQEGGKQHSMPRLVLDAGLSHFVFASPLHIFAWTALEALHFPKEHREITDLWVPGGTEARVKFPNTSGGSQVPAAKVQEGVESGAQHQVERGEGQAHILNATVLLPQSFAGSGERR